MVTCSRLNRSRTDEWLWRSALARRIVARFSISWAQAVRSDSIDLKTASKVDVNEAVSWDRADLVQSCTIFLQILTKTIVYSHM